MEIFLYFGGKILKVTWGEEESLEFMIVEKRGRFHVIVVKVKT